MILGRKRKSNMAKYHHFKGSSLDRSEKIQRLVCEIILARKVADFEAENSKVWELKHSATCVHIAKIIARKRRLNVELCGVIAALHDIYAIETGKYKEHAKKGAIIARKILERSEDFSKLEIDLACKAIENHSDKFHDSKEPYCEMIKDADSFDVSLYKDGIYNEKPPAQREYYLARISKVERELGL